MSEQVYTVELSPLDKFTIEEGLRRMYRSGDLFERDAKHVKKLLDALRATTPDPEK